MVEENHFLAGEYYQEVRVKITIVRHNLAIVRIIILVIKNKGPIFETSINLNQKRRKYKFPPIDLLNEPRAKSAENHAETMMQRGIIDNTLARFKIGGRVENYTKAYRYSI